jgi:hypothetical protein
MLWSISSICGLLPIIAAKSDGFICLLFMSMYACYHMCVMCLPLQPLCHTCMCTLCGIVDISHEHNSGIAQTLLMNMNDIIGIRHGSAISVCHINGDDSPITDTSESPQFNYCA